MEEAIIIKFAKGDNKINAIMHPITEEITLADLQAAQEADPIIRQVREWVLVREVPITKEVRREVPALLDYHQVFSMETFGMINNILHFLP